ncbi:MAG: hypothetical protein KatS3mg027_2084 [Bacteroidia bacterium]|nr:MAG: hypothetical protein KatS3mg027_2084 [Bacteroidia bacterium]
MIWHLLKYLLSFSIPAFFRKIQIKNVHYLKNNYPSIIISNHPNAFMDPISFSYMVYPPRVRYMARGDAFKPGLVSHILQSIGIIPIYRMQDAGAEGVKKNSESYRVVYNLLRRNKKVMIFGEGICVQEKRLRPLKKGVPRLIFNAQLEMPEKDIYVIPVCLNYSNPSQIGSTLFIHVGEPFLVRDNLNEFSQNPNAVMQQSMKEWYDKMLPLIVHIDNPENDQIFEQTRIVLSEVLCDKRGLDFDNLENVFIVEKEIADCINKVSKSHSELFRMFSKKVEQMYEWIEKYQVHIPTLFYYPKNTFILTLVTLLHLLIFVVYTAAKFSVQLFFALPYWLSRFLSKKISPSIEFYASFFLAFSTFIFLFYFIIYYYVMSEFIHPFKVLMQMICSLAFIPLLHYYPIYRKKVLTLLKILKSKTFALNLSKNLQEIVNDYEYLKKVADFK